MNSDGSIYARECMPEEEKEPITLELGGSGLIAWIDEEDADLAARSWTLKKAGTKEFPHYYAISKINIGNVRFEDYLHNVVWERMMGVALPSGFLVDHINGDKLDNRRLNLRMATRADNEANKRKRRTQGSGTTSSQYKGVNKLKDGRKKCWRATITYEGRQINLKCYYSEREAAEAYNKAALEYYGEFALINEFEEDSNGSGTD
jgi:hypothetical protein